MNFKQIVFMTAFPNRDKDSSTILIYGEDARDHHLLVWIPKARMFDCNIVLESDDWELKRKIIVNGSTYAIDEDLLKIIDLDFEKKVSKASIEKMFDCKVIE